jgi:excisionase family DNA binding protein
MSEPVVAGISSGRSVFVEEAAALLRVSRRTVYYRIRQGKLRTIRTRCGSQRILIESIQALLRHEAAVRALRRAARSKAQPLALEVQAFP